MAIIVETGAGLSTAETYITVAGADTYHSDRANTAWAALTTQLKEAYLRRATEYMLQVYRMKWKGVRMTAAQALDWPRAYVYTQPFLHGAVGEFPYLVASDIVPVEVARACAELALRAIGGSLAPDIGRLKKRVKVDVIETEYVDGATPYVRYRAIDRMLDPFMGGSDNTIKLVRA